MQSLSFTFSAAILFLVLCLQLGVTKGQDNDVRKPLVFDLTVPSTADKNKEFTVKLQLGTQYNECLVVRAYLVSNKPVDGSFNYVQTRCLCNDHSITLFWDVTFTETTTFAIVVDIVKEKDICPDDVAVVPIIGDRYFAYKTVFVN